MTIKTISRDELTTRAWAARVNIHVGEHEADALIGGVLYIARLAERDGGAA